MREPFEWRHPVDELEPIENPLSVAAETLSEILRAIADQSSAVSAGNEALAHIAIAFPAQFPGGFAAPSVRITGDYAFAARAFSRLFSFIAGGWGKTRSSEVGVRALVAVYVLRPDLLDGISLNVLGRKLGVTRQNLSKHARAIRDTHSGIKNRAMKSENHRENSRIAATRSGNANERRVEMLPHLSAAVCAWARYARAIELGHIQPRPDEIREETREMHRWLTQFHSN